MTTIIGIAKISLRYWYGSEIGKNDRSCVTAHVNIAA